MAEYSILDTSVMVHLDVSVWSGRAKLRREDIPNADNLPPSALASLGSKKLIDPSELTVFNTLRARASTMLDKMGVRFLGGWLLHKDRLGDADSELLLIRNEFVAAASEFIDKYEANVESWLGNFPDWASVIRPVLPSKFDMQRKFGFDWQVYTVRPAEDNCGNMTDQLNDLPNAALREVIGMVWDIYHEVFENRTTITKRGLRPVRTLISKLDSISYIHPILFNVKQAFVQALGWLEPSVQDEKTVLRFKRFLLSMTNEEGIKLAFEGAPVTSSSDIEVLVSDMIGTAGGSAPEAEEAEEPAQEESVSINNMDSLGLW